MKLIELYNEIIKIGIENDPRGKANIQRVLKERSKLYQKLSQKEKAYFDIESLTNPFADSRIIAGDPSKNISTIMVGIDIDTSELLLAYTLNAKGKKIDLLLSHHPSGKALATFYEVMDLQIDIFNAKGVSLNVAENMLWERKAEVARKISAANCSKAKDAADLLGLNLMSAHTVSDSLAYKFLEKKFAQKKPQRLEGVVTQLMEIDEYKEASRRGSPPRIIQGRPQSRVKNIHLEFTGGTEGPKHIYGKLSNAGVDTIVAMHLSEDHFQQAKKAKLNIVLAGHIASDNLGMNLLLDRLQKKFKFKVFSCSGFKRFSHR